jgi:hypothetical protein
LPWSKKFPHEDLVLKIKHFLPKNEKYVHPENLKPIAIQTLILWKLSETSQLGTVANENVENTSAKTYHISRHK